MIFDSHLIPAIRAGRITKTLIPASQHVTTGRVRQAHRRTHELDPDGNPIRTLVTPTTIVLTVLDAHPTVLPCVTFADARACGYKTTDELRQAWQNQHPRTVNVQIVTFAFGDTRDRPIYLAYTRHFKPGVQGDYTHSPSRASDAGEVPGSDILERYAQAAMLKRIEERGDEITRERIRSLSIRLKDAGRLGNMPLVAKISSEIAALVREHADETRPAA